MERKEAREGKILVWTRISQMYAIYNVTNIIGKGEQFALMTLKTCWFILFSEYKVELQTPGVPEPIYTRFGFPEPKGGIIMLNVKKL